MSIAILQREIEADELRVACDTLGLALSHAKSFDPPYVVGYLPRLLESAEVTRAGLVVWCNGIRADLPDIRYQPHRDYRNSCVYVLERHVHRTT